MVDLVLSQFSPQKRSIVISNKRKDLVFIQSRSCWCWIHWACRRHRRGWWWPCTSSKWMSSSSSRAGTSPPSLNSPSFLPPTMVPRLLLCCKNNARINKDQNVKNCAFKRSGHNTHSWYHFIAVPDFRTGSVSVKCYLCSVDSDLVKALLTNPKSVLSMVSARTALLFLFPQAAATAGVVLDL